MLCRTSVGRQLQRWLRSACFVSLGVLLSISLNALALSPSIAQTTANQIPNNSSIQFDASESDNPDDPEGRASILSNSVFYRLGAVAGENNLGLGIVKSANKSAAEPGDVVIYTLLVNNNSAINATTLQVDDRFPLGVEYVPGSAVATIADGDTNPDNDPVQAF